MIITMSNDQFKTIRQAFINDNVSLDKFMDWTGKNMVDEFVRENNSELTFETVEELNELNTLYHKVKSFIKQN